MKKDKIIAQAEGKLSSLHDCKKTHYIPKSISENPNFPLKTGISNIVELYDGFIIIRPKGRDDQ